MQHHVDRELTGIRVGLDDGVAALMFLVAAVRIGEPEPQPGRGRENDLGKQTCTHQVDSHEMRGEVGHGRDCCAVVARSKSARQHALKTPFRHVHSLLRRATN